MVALILPERLCSAHPTGLCHNICALRWDHLTAFGGKYYIVANMNQQPSPGEFEQIVLLAALRLGDNAYGVTILAEIAVRAGRNVSPGALYTTLHRMEDKGFVTFRDGSPTPERGGRAKRFVTVTREGRSALVSAQTAYRRLLDGLDLLIEPVRLNGTVYA
jgi:PadR family transcriptional regulator, regulatory protein PadR